MRLRNLITFVLVVAAQFVIFEVGLRTWGSSEAAPSFQGLFETDPAIGYRLKPHARTHFATSEFAADIAINGAGLRDDEELGPKSKDERRIVLLGDSLVLSVQVPFRQTFGELLELLGRFGMGRQLARQLGPAVLAARQVADGAGLQGQGGTGGH